MGVLVGRAKICRLRARAEKPRGDWGVRARFAPVFAASLLSNAPDKTAMLHRLESH